MDRLRYILNSPLESRTENGACPPLNGDIVFDHVTFGYEKEKPVLKDLDFTIRGGSIVGIMGPTGSGKSTVQYLLNRLYEPDQGSISIGGVPIREMSLPWLRSQIGFVMQEPYLFSRTIRENITMAGEVSEERLHRAVRVASLEETLDRFSEGYDTMVGERGVTLSGGQKQRTAIARMLVQETPVMIFDDSLSAVDAETDEKIRRALKEYAGQATMILISHRISTLMDADRIIVLEDGRITAEGTHAELLKKSELYRSIYEIQSPEANL